MAEQNNAENILFKWIDWVDMKNPYQFGIEEFDMEQFTSVLEETYDLICAWKGKFLGGQCEAGDIFDFSALISVMSRYIPDSCADDESEGRLFTVTCMLTEALVDFATSASDHALGNETIRADGQGGPRKICCLRCDLKGCLVYDFDTGDYSDFTAYANGRRW